jgi:signal transduction histidine kinase/CheY-like chemotaxis protein
MSGFFKFTKFKLVAGHLVLFAAAAAVIWMIQQQTRRLAEEDPGEIASRRKIFLISNTLTRLYEAEVLGMAISWEADAGRFPAYTRVIREVKSDMDSLRRWVATPRQESQIVAVQDLLDQQIENMKALLQVKLAPSPADFYDRSVHTLSALRDTLPGTPAIRVRKERSVDSVYTQPPKRGFWSSIFKPRPKPVLQVNSSERVVIDTLPPARRAPVQNADTALRAIKSAWEEYQEQLQLQTRELHRKEIAVLQNGRHLSEQIKIILNGLEEEEVHHALARVDERAAGTRELTRAIATVATVACLLVSLLVSLAFNDISRGQRYRVALEEANLLARKLLRGRERLILTVTHDIKSPLNSITGHVELLENTPLTGRQRHFLNNVNRSAGHILQLVNNLLDFSRLEAGKMEVDAVRYNPGKLLAETAEGFLPQAAREGLTLTCRVEESLDRDRVGDPIRVRQIVTNLLSNAIKYTREGGVELRAACTGETPAMLEITVTDTGAGMTAGEQQIVFEEFTRLDARHNDGAEGTGLGLTITRQLVALLGGTIHLASVKGEGSTFTVRLPLGESPAGQTPPAPAGEESPAMPVPARVLIIDDDPLQLEMIAEFLRQKGIACETRDRATGAIEALEGAPFDVLLTDIQMPECDGFKLVEEIRHSPREAIRDLPVIAQSARGDMTERDYLEAGFSAYLNKPYSPRQLLDCIARLRGVATTPPAETVTLPPPARGEYDLATVRLFADNDERATREIVASFARDCQANFLLLEEYLAREEYPPARQLAHKMLPMFKQLAITGVVPALVALEQAELPPADPETVKRTMHHVVTRGREVLVLITRDLALH